MSNVNARTRAPTRPTATTLARAGLALWVVIGLAVITAGLDLGHHAHLAEWGIAFVAAAAAGAAAGLPLAARRAAPSTTPGLPRPAHLPRSRPERKEANR